MGKGIELNTGGYHYGLGEPNPCVGIIRRYRELGERSSPSVLMHTHLTKRYAFDRAEAVLDRCGFLIIQCLKNISLNFCSLRKNRQCWANTKNPAMYDLILHCRIFSLYF